MLQGVHAVVALVCRLTFVWSFWSTIATRGQTVDSSIRRIDPLPVSPEYAVEAHMSESQTGCAATFRGEPAHVPNVVDICMSTAQKCSEEWFATISRRVNAGKD